MTAVHLFAVNRHIYAQGIGCPVRRAQWTMLDSGTIIRGTSPGQPL